MVQRGGNVSAKKVDDVTMQTLTNEIMKNVKEGAKL